MGNTRPARIPATLRAGLIAAGLLVILGATGRTEHAAGAAQDSDAKSQQTLMTVCGKCHPIDRVIANRRTRSQWEEVITTMITARGAQVSDEDFEVILAYLTKEYGRVDINRARPDDIVEVLAIPETMATAIVAYRKEHGPFADFDALAKVPGVDRDALEKKRDAITF